jgi:hypothetical protein
MEDQDKVIAELKEKLEAEKKETTKAHDARRRAKDERDEIEKKLFDLQAKQADNNATLSRLERELNLGSTSPMDWDRGKKGDLVERIMNAFKTKAGGDVSLRSAHETLIRQFQQLSQKVQDDKEGYTVVFNALEKCGLSKGASSSEIAKFIGNLTDERFEPELPHIAPGAEKNESYHAHVSAPEKGGDIHIHLHIV